MRIVFRADASPEIGGGHVMRCLALAEELVARGGSCRFLCSSTLPAIEKRVRAARHDLLRLRGTVLERPCDAGPLPAEIQEEDARTTLEAVVDGCDWLVVDHYGLDQIWERRARSFATGILVIDDLANRSHDCDLLLDQTMGRRSGDYANLVPAGARVIAGSAFALLRPEFAQLRPKAVERRQFSEPPKRLLLSLGMSDVGGITGRILSAVIRLDLGLIIDVVLGSAAPSRAAVEAIAARNPAVRVHLDSSGMAELVLEADVAIGASGTSTWERCCLGLPTVQLILAENQREIAEPLDAAGAAMSANESSAGRALEQLIADAQLRNRMSAAALAVTEGTGAAMLADEIMGKSRAGLNELSTRLARESDSRDLWLWRNDPDTRAASRTREPITWADHSAWFDGALHLPGRWLYIVERAGDPIGVVRFDATGSSHEVSINIRPNARGGVGRSVLAEAVRAFFQREGPSPLEASIRQDNLSSRRIFEALGFQCIGKAGDDAFSRFVRPAEPLA